jgi:hypothetical protein
MLELVAGSIGRLQRIFIGVSFHQAVCKSSSTSNSYPDSARTSANVPTNAHQVSLSCQNVATILPHNLDDYASEMRFVRMTLCSIDEALMARIILSGIGIVG